MSREQIHKTLQIQFPIVLLIVCVLILFTTSQPVVFLALSAGLFFVVLTVLFPDKLNQVFLFLLCLIPRYAGIQISASIPDITFMRILIIYYLGFSILLNHKTMIDNLKKIRFDVIHIAMIFLIISNVIVLLNTWNGAAFKKFFSVVGENILLFYLVYLNVKDHKELRKCIDAFLLSSCIISLFGFFEFATGTNVFTTFGGIGAMSSMGGLENLTGSAIRRLGYFRAYVTFSHPIALGEYLLMVFFLAFTFFLYEKNRGKQLFYGMTSMLTAIAMTLTLSRAPMICMLCGIAGLFIVTSRQAKMKMLKVFALLGLVAVFFFISDFAPKFFTNGLSQLFLSLTGEYVGGFGGNMQAFDSRLDLIPLTREIVAGSELWGRGLAFFSTNQIFTFNYAMNPFEKYQIDTIDNFYLLRIIEGGILGVFFYVLAFSTFLYTAVRMMTDAAKKRIDATTRTIAQAVFISMGSYLVCLVSADELGTMKVFWVLCAFLAVADRNGGGMPTSAEENLAAQPGSCPLQPKN